MMVYNIGFVSIMPLVCVKIQILFVVFLLLFLHHKTTIKEIHTQQQQLIRSHANIIRINITYIQLMHHMLFFGIRNTNNIIKITYASHELISI